MTPERFLTQRGRAGSERAVAKNANFLRDPSIQPTTQAIHHTSNMQNQATGSRGSETLGHDSACGLRRENASVSHCQSENALELLPIGRRIRYHNQQTGKTHTGTIEAVQKAPFGGLQYKVALDEWIGSEFYAPLIHTYISTSRAVELLND